MKEIDEIQKQKQEISVQCQNGIYFIKELYYKMACFKEFMNRFNKILIIKLKHIPRFQALYLFLSFATV
jgi:hypothetical protein